MKVAIIGAGLAGCAAAYVLKQQGAEPVIYEAGGEIAPGASGNESGLYNPRLSASRTPESLFYAAAFALAVRTFAGLQDIGWNRCGALHLMNDEKREKRFRQTVQNWGWHAEHMRLVDEKEAGAIAGIDIPYGALYLPDSGSVSPRKLCRAYTKGIEIHLNTPVADLSQAGADAVILACGMGAKNFIDLPLQAVRGQITYAEAGAISRNLKTNLCYGGYFSAPIEGVHTVGSTFQRWLDHTDILPEDDSDNIGKLEEVLPALAAPPSPRLRRTGGLEISGQRAAVRATSKDHFPIVGEFKIPAFAGKAKGGKVFAGKAFVSTAHGSHGILSTLAGAHVLADMIMDRSPGQGEDTIRALSPQRF